MFRFQVNDASFLTSSSIGECVLKNGTNRAAESENQQETPSDSGHIMDANLEYFYQASDQGCGECCSNSSINKSPVGETIDAYGRLS